MEATCGQVLSSGYGDLVVKAIHEKDEDGESLRDEWSSVSEDERSCGRVMLGGFSGSWWSSGARVVKRS